MLKKLGCAARKLILITTLMALVATVTSCGSDDKSATESRTRNFSAKLDCGEPTVAPEPVAQTPMAETVEEAEQAAAAAFAAMREAEEAARYLEEERRYAQQEATAAYAEWEKNGRTEADWDVAAAADARTSVVNDNLDLALSNMGQVSMFHTLLVNHTMQIGGETGRNSSADAERNACLAEERQLYADWEAQQAALELEQQKNDLRLINEQINALDESGVTRADQIVLTENRVAAEREAAAAADKLKNFFLFSSFILSKVVNRAKTCCSSRSVVEGTPPLVCSNTRIGSSVRITVPGFNLLAAIIPHPLPIFPGIYF